jgi:hypothetical protein
MKSLGVVVQDICGLLMLVSVAICAGTNEGWSFERAMLVSILWFAIRSSHDKEEK